MKTYIAFAKENKGFKMVAIEAISIVEASNLLKSKGIKANKSSIQLSSVSVDYVTCEVII